MELLFNALAEETATVTKKTFGKHDSRPRHVNRPSRYLGGRFFFKFAPICLQNVWGPSAKSGRNALGTPKNKGTECVFPVKVPAVPYVSQHLS